MKQSEEEYFRINDKRGDPLAPFVKMKKKVFDEITPGEMMVYLSLDYFRNQKTGRIFPSIEKLRTKARAQRRGLFKALDSLEKKKIIKRYKTSGRVNSYILLK